jgi:hypothetical protein
MVNPNGWREVIDYFITEKGIFNDLTANLNLNK